MRALSGTRGATSSSSADREHHAGVDYYQRNLRAHATRGKVLLDEEFPDIPEVGGDASFHVYRRDAAGRNETADEFME